MKFPPKIRSQFLEWDVRVIDGSNHAYALTRPSAVFHHKGELVIGGLNWFHAHVHGRARPDVMAGQSGMLQVGDLLDTLRAAPSLTAAAKTALDQTDVLYLGQAKAIMLRKNIVERAHIPEWIVRTCYWSYATQIETVYESCFRMSLK